jgi:hypothetical protein
MSVTSRSPGEVLDELGAQLDAAFRRPTRRRWASRRTSGRRALLAVLVVIVVGVSTAAATQTIFSPAPPLPRLARVAVNLASDAVGSPQWRLSASRCSRPRGSYSVLLQAAGVGAGSPCGELIQPPSVVYGSRFALAFGVVSRDTARVDLALGSVRMQTTPVAIAHEALRAGGLSDGLRVYVVRIAPAAVVTAMTAYDADGHLVLACRQRSCVKP